MELKRGPRGHGRAKRLQPLSAVTALVLGAVAVLSLREPSSWAARSALIAAAGEEEGTNPSCETIRFEEKKAVEPRLRNWEKAAAEGRTLLGYGTKASKLLNKTLDSYDKAVRAKLGEGSSCEGSREVLDHELQQQLHSIFLMQRSTIEQVLYQRLKKDLLRKMRRKKRELNVKEKLRLLHGAMNDYDSQVKELLPYFVENTERDRAEKRLSELQWGIGDTPEAKEMQQRWKMERMRRMPMRQSKGISVSLSPGMRLMFRPSGFGNFQVYSRRQVGPMHNPNEVSIGLHNDGKVIDVYNKKPTPPLIKFQPTIGIDVSAS
mmetsp:Transcript_87439/g.155077  ORF Transcript_87439/g.155077 Transcript_87439/m.155077 type:complete len:320 (-) Transcript_87439:35-994(-)